MSTSSISIDLDDPRTAQVAEALANKTCVKILGLIAEDEMREVDIANKLSLPLNTVEYNLKKLINVGLIEKSSNFFWSVKGKKTPVYKVANRRIVISPKRIVKGVIPAVLISGVGALLLKTFTQKGIQNTAGVERFADSASTEAFANLVSEVTTSSVESSGFFGAVWTWFFIGALFSLIILFLWDFVVSNTRRLK